VSGFFHSHLVGLDRSLNVFLQFSDSINFLLLKDVHVEFAIAHTAQLALVLLHMFCELHLRGVTSLGTQTNLAARLPTESAVFQVEVGHITPRAFLFGGLGFALACKHRFLSLEHLVLKRKRHLLIEDLHHAGRLAHNLKLLCVLFVQLLSVFKTCILHK